MVATYNFGSVYFGREYLFYRRMKQGMLNIGIIFEPAHGTLALITLAISNPCSLDRAVIYQTHKALK